MEEKLEILCVAFQRPAPLMSQLWSLACQTRQDFSIRIIHDGPPPSDVSRLIQDFQDQNPAITLRMGFSQERFGDWGHSLREIGLRESSSEYLLITNDDNYYAPQFVEKMLPPLELGADIAYCNMIHSHPTRFRDPGSVWPKKLSYRPMLTRPRLNRIDIGGFVFRTKLGQRVGFQDKSFAADGIFLEEMKRHGAKLAKVPDYLFVHN